MALSGSFSMSGQKSRPHMIGGSFEDDDDYETRPSRSEQPQQKTEGTLFFGAANTVQVIENTTTQADSHAGSNGATKVVDSLSSAFDVFNKIDKPAEAVAESVQEVGGAIWDLFKNDVVGAREKPPANPQKAAEAERKKKELVMFIKQQQNQQQMDRYAAINAKKAEVARTMERMGVSTHEVVKTSTTEISVSSVFWVALVKAKEKIFKKKMPSSGKGKAPQGLQLNSSAQEGQSLVSSSGSIASAG